MNSDKAQARLKQLIRETVGDKVDLLSKEGEQLITVLLVLLNVWDEADQSCNRCATSQQLISAVDFAQKTIWDSLNVDIDIHSGEE